MFWQKIIFILLMTGLILNIGCGNKTETKDEYLIRVGENIVTVLDFQNVLEIAKTAYSHDSIQDPEVLKTVKLQLLNQMTEEVVLYSKADDLNITISDSELKKAVENIKADYPEGIFEQTLLESALSFEAWKERLKVRLLMEKVISEDLESKIILTPEEIAKYYKEHYKGNESDSEIKKNPEDLKAHIIKNLRKQKTEESYPGWIKSIHKKYKIEINKEQWGKIIGL